MERAAAPHVPAANNFRDGLGERRRINHAGTDTIELLCLRRELTAVPSFEFALRERASRLASFRHDGFARVRSIDRLSEPSATLAVVSDVTRGVRLSQLITPNEKRPVTIDVNAAQRLIRQIVSSVAALHESARDLAHGAIALERIIVTANARIAISEYVLGAALEQLRYSPARYWQDLRIAVPPASAAPTKFDQRVDVVQIGMVALSLVLGRPLTDDEQPARLGDVLASAAAISPRGGSEPLSTGLREWIGRALQLDSRHSFASAPEARAALEKLVSAAAASEALESRPKPQSMPPAAGERNDVELSARMMPAAPARSAPPFSRSVPALPPQSAVAPAIPRVPFPGPTAIVPAVENQAAVAPASQKPPLVIPEAQPTIRQEIAATVAPVAKALPELPAASVVDPTDSDFEDSTPEDDTGQTGNRKRRLRIAMAAAAVAAIVAGGTYGGRWFFATPVQEVRTGTLNVASNPAGAQVFVDRQGRGMTPLTLTLRPGAHSIELRGMGEPRTVDVTIVAGTQTSQLIELVKSVPVAPGQLQVRTEPAGAQINVDGVARGKAPMLVEGLTPGEHTVILESDFGTVKQTVTIESSTTASMVVPMAAPSALSSAPVSGWITVTAPVDVEIREQGKVLGTSQSERVMVSAGRHQLEIVSDTLGYRATTVVQVMPGKVVPVKIEWPKGTASLNAEPWAEVWIDGEKVGDTPIGNLSLPIGPHEIVFKHPELGEQRHAVSVSLKSPARVSVDMRKQP